VRSLVGAHTDWSQLLLFIVLAAYDTTLTNALALILTTVASSTSNSASTQTWPPQPSLISARTASGSWSIRKTTPRFSSCMKASTSCGSSNFSQSSCSACRECCGLDGVAPYTRTHHAIGEQCVSGERMEIILERLGKAKPIARRLM